MQNEINDQPAASEFWKRVFGVFSAPNGQSASALDVLELAAEDLRRKRRKEAVDELSQEPRS